MTSFDKLQRLFTEFPGIGPRQAQRFASFLLRKDDRYINELITALTDARSHMKVCTDTFMYFYSTNESDTLSPIARDKNRDHGTILIVEKDVDVTSIERSGGYNGTYFVLGGTAPIVESDAEKHIRLNELRGVIERKGATITEVILGLSAHPEGENTAGIITRSLSPLAKKHGFTISTLGRGLSTGTELEYSDEDTIKNALRNRG